MKINVRAEGYKFTDLFDELDRLEGHLGEAALEGTEAIAQVVEQSMKNTYGKSGDFIADSIGYNVEMGRDQKSAVASVGVFHVDKVMAKHLKFNMMKSKDQPGFGIAKQGVTAPQIAWWAEYGTVYQPARPFLESGYLLSINQQEEAFAEAFNKIIDKAAKT